VYKGIKVLIGKNWEKIKSPPVNPDPENSLDLAIAGLLSLLRGSWETIEHLTDQYGEYFTEVDIDRIRVLDLELDNVKADLREALRKLDD
jgi:hypothetical protein